jgi:hypothetical protein
MARVFGVVLGLLGQTFTYPSQIWFSSDTVGVNIGQVITPELSNTIQETLDIWNITGLSVAIVPKSGEPEYHSWGNRTEDGDKTTEDVRTAEVTIGMRSEATFPDVIPHGVCVQGILRERAWYFDGRL